GFVLPAEQTVSGSADPAALAAVAFSSTLDMSFKNVSSLLKVTVEEEGIKQIVVRATDGTALAGTVQVNPVTGAVIGVSGGSDSITLNPSGETFATGDYYISAIPSGNDLELSVIALRSSDVRKGLVETARTLVRATAVETAASSAFDWAYRIGSNADLRAWATDKANWNKSGEDVYIVSDINMNDEPWTTLTDSYGGRILGGGHCISHINIQSNTSANVGFFGKGYAKELHDLTFGSEDGLTYDGTSCIINGLVTESTSAKWNYTGIVTVAGADIVNVTNFVPMTVLASSNRSSRVAGIAGWTTDKVHITGCRNYGTITVEDHAITDGDDYVYLAAAGILGGLNTETGEAYVNDCHNHGLITSISHCQNAMAGIVGMSYHTVVKLSVTNCTNSGRIELIYTDTQNENFCMGGIVGKATGAAGKEAEITGCTNTGAIYSEAVHQHYVGGIAGYGDGVSITSCRNEGSVAIDHSKAASARFQHVGGILGATMPKYGANNLTGNVNMGRVSMKVASSGHNATPKSTTTFYGVNAGGILGCANNVSSLSSNRNEGDVVAENDYKATKTAYPALVHVGGIVGYDFGALEGFSSNTFTGTITAKTTNSESVASKVYAGGIIGRQRAATMLSGAGDGSITTQAAATGAVRYAGSIAGYNDGTIESCTYSGMVDGAEATASNTVGGGNAPQSSGQLTLNATIDGYRGIWYDLGQVEAGEEEYGSKYSGGLGSYSMKHIPMAVYSPVANRTYFVFGGTANYIDGVTTAEEQGRLLCMIGCYDHTTGMLQKPRIVMDKTADPHGTYDDPKSDKRVFDPHDNPTVQIDKDGYVFVFVSGRSTRRDGVIFRSRKPFDITSFEVIKEDEKMGYPQVMYHPDKGFFLFFTRYDGVRKLHYRTSPDGRDWSSAYTKLADIKEEGQTESGHYQISNMWGTKICTAFNRHPNGTVNKRTNVYYVQTTDWGKTWTTASGEPVEIPVVTWNSNCLVRDYQHTTETHNCYIKDLNFDANGNPIILYLTSRNHKSGPSGGTRQWWTDHWTGSEWVRREITTSTHNYDSGSLWVEGNDWVVLAPTDAGPQFWGAGGEVVRWRSSDEGLSWVKEMTLTSNSQNNQTYMRRPWYAADGFYSFWADGSTTTLTRSYLYFCDKAGAVFRMPYNMTAEWASPEPVM
ncbi:MAG: BNR-4 repeat-containing protein, partial [Bacteroidales bacterium]|nr:BNR-4 repeat-containing protein [Bacteroidales bacterium]